MKNRSLLSTLFLWYCTILCILLTASNIQAQTCPLTDYVLTSQAEVDAFPAGCSSIAGDLIIRGQSITDLTPLSNINRIDGRLIIDGNTLLQNLDGLNSLGSVGGNCSIIQNLGLLNINGLSNLSSIGGSLSLAYNFQLSNVDGLSNLSSIEGGIYLNDNTSLLNLNGFSNVRGEVETLALYLNRSIRNLDGISNITSVIDRLIIGGTDYLTNLDALSNITSVGGLLEIVDNDGLTNLNGLSNISRVGGDFNLYSNDRLSDCCGIFDLIKTPGIVSGSIQIEANNSGCDNISEINDYCDTDADGVQDEKDNCPSTPNPDQTDVDLDGIGDICDLSLAIDVAIPNAIDFIENLGLGGRQKDALKTKLENARDQYCDGRINAALKQLNDFIGIVADLLNEGQLTDNEAAFLIGVALEIIDAIQTGTAECSTPLARLSPQRSTFSTIETNTPQIDLFPNPAGRSLGLRLQVPEGNTTILSIVDQVGRTVFRRIQDSGSQQLEIDLTQGKFVSGSYYVQLVTDREILTRKFVVNQ